MKKRGITFLEALMLSLTLMLIFSTMAHSTYPSVSEMNLSDKICLEQGTENREFHDFGCRDPQNAKVIGIMLKFGSVRNVIRANGKTLPWPTRIFAAHPKSMNAQVSFQYLSRVSPLPEPIN